MPYAFSKERIQVLYQYLSALPWNCDHLNYAYRHCAPYPLRRFFDTPEALEFQDLASRMAQQLASTITRRSGSEQSNVGRARHLLLDWLTLVCRLSAKLNSEITAAELEPLIEWSTQESKRLKLDFHEANEAAKVAAERFGTGDVHVIVAIDEVEGKLNNFVVHAWERVVSQEIVTDAGDIRRCSEKTNWKQFKKLFARILKDSSSKDPIIEFVVKKHRLRSGDETLWPNLTEPGGNPLDNQYRIIFRSWERCYTGNLPEQTWKERWERLNDLELDILRADVIDEFPPQLQTFDCAAIRRPVVDLDINKILAADILVAMWPRGSATSVEQAQSTLSTLPSRVVQEPDWREYLRTQRRTSILRDTPSPTMVLLWDGYYLRPPDISRERLK